jgi:acyl-CoA hydrolase
LNIINLKKLCPDKLVTAEEATAVLKNGSRILIGSGCGEPQHLIRAMVDNQRIEDIMICQMFAFTLSNYINDKDFLRRFSLKLFLSAL